MAMSIHYALYVNPLRILVWYIEEQNTTFTVTINGQTYPTDVKELMKEAFDEWKDAFKTPSITIVQTTLANKKNARIRVHVSHNDEPCLIREGENQRDYAPVLANYRGAFSYNKEFGYIVFYEKCFQQMLGNASILKDMKEATGDPNITTQQIINYAVKYYAKRYIGYLFGLADTTTNTAPSRSNVYYVHVNIRNYQTAVFQTRTRIGQLTGGGDPVSIMVGNIVDYFRYLHARLGRAVGINDIIVTVGDQEAVEAEEATCARPSLTQKDGSIILNCDFAGMKAITISYLANNTARTTSLVSKK